MTHRELLKRVRSCGAYAYLLIDSRGRGRDWSRYTKAELAEIVAKAGKVMSDQSKEAANARTVATSPAAIAWTRAMLKRFKRAHGEALKAGGRDSVFVFDGHEFLVGYAGYLVEYLESRGLR